MAKRPTDDEQRDPTDDGRVIEPEPLDPEPLEPEPLDPEPLDVDADDVNDFVDNYGGTEDEAGEEPLPGL